MRKFLKPPDAHLHQTGNGQFQAVSEGASVIIGAQDSPDGSFIPGLRASKWDEAWLTCVADGIVPEKTKPKWTKDKHNRDCAEHVSKRHGKSELHRFREGSTKWEIEWSKRTDVPGEGYVDFLLDFAPGMTFDKQSPLTQQEIDEGYEQPEDVKNSYAIYWPRAGRFLNHGEEIVNYEAGKVGHIYRPLLLDDNGQHAWVDQTLILDNGTKLRCYLDQAWLNSAKFPVILDPTFGYGGNGSATATLTLAVCTVGSALVYTAVSGAYIAAYSVFIYDGVAAETVYAACYSLSGTTVQNRLQGGVSVYSPAGTLAWVTTSGLNQPLSAGTVYGMAIGDYATGGNASAKIKYDTGTGTNRVLHNAVSLPATWTNNGSSGTRYSFYATYDIAAGQPTSKRFGGVQFSAIGNRGMW